MQFSKLILSFLCLLFFSCNGNLENAYSYKGTEKEVGLIEIDALTLNALEGLVYYTGKPFTGTSIEYYPNGQKATTIDYRQGKKHGFYRKWFKQGALSFESQYQDGKQHGTTKSWWSSTQLRSALNFVEGVPHGVQQQWYKSGAKFKKQQLQYGKEEGLQQSWRENGKIYNNYEAKNGRIFGLKRANLCYELDNEVVNL